MKYELKIRDTSGKNLEVVQELPQKGDKFATILMVPGFGMDLHEYGLFDEVSHSLVKHGFQTFRFSYEGMGKSEGIFAESSLDDQVQQLKDILEYIEKDRFTEISQLGIFAKSFGGIVTLSTLPLPQIKSFLFMSLPTDPLSSLQKYFREERGFNPNGFSKRKRSDGTVTEVGPRWWQSMANKSFVTMSSQIEAPTLLLYGQKDSRFNASHGQFYFEALRGKKRFQMIEKADHSFTGVFRPRVLELSSEWFEETLH